MYYVYAFLRDDGSPYYIGKGKDYRAWAKHNINLPKNKQNIIIMESNLTELGAFALERRYIEWYGRKDLGTGILRNLTDGGEGSSLSIIIKNKISNSNKGKSSWSKGKNLSETHKNNISKSHLGKRTGLWSNEKNPKFGKGNLILGQSNPNAKKWILLVNDVHIVIDDLVKYCKDNCLNYSTVYSWQKQYINGQKKLNKVVTECH
jgi:hypothetical protein